MRLRGMRRWAAAAAVALGLVMASAGIAQADDPAGSCRYNSHTTSGHCYSILTSSSLPAGVSQVSIVLKSQCMYLSTATSPTSSLFNTIWAITPDTSAYTEFGLKIENPTPSGYPQKHWYAQRHMPGGSWVNFNSTRAWSAGVNYSAAIRYVTTGPSGWQFWAGNTAFFSWGGAYPYGPIKKVNAGAESAHDDPAGPSGAQNSFVDNTTGRIQNGTAYSGWGTTVTQYSSVGPFATASWNSSSISNRVPGAPLGASGGTC